MNQNEDTHSTTFELTNTGIPEKARIKAQDSIVFTFSLASDSNLQHLDILSHDGNKTPNPPQNRQHSSYLQSPEHGTHGLPLSPGGADKHQATVRSSRHPTG